MYHCTMGHDHDISDSELYHVTIIKTIYLLPAYYQHSVPKKFTTRTHFYLEFGATESSQGGHNDYILFLLSK